MKKYMYIFWAVILVPCTTQSIFTGSSTSNSYKQKLPRLMRPQLEVTRSRSASRLGRATKRKGYTPCTATLLNELPKNEPKKQRLERWIIEANRFLPREVRARRSTVVTLTPLPNTVAESTTQRRHTFPVENNHTPDSASTRRKKKKRRRVCRKRRKAEVLQENSGSRLQPLHWRIKHGFTCSLLDYSIDFLAEYKGINAFEQALKKGNKKVILSVIRSPQIQMILKTGNMPLIPRERLNTYLHDVVQVGVPQLVDHLLAHGATDSLADSKGSTPLDVALTLYEPASESCLEYATIIKSLFQAAKERGQEGINFSEEDVQTKLSCLLHDFIWIGYKQGVAYFIANVGIDINTIDTFHGGTPLCTAVLRYSMLKDEQHDKQRGNIVKIIVALLESGADIDVEFTPLEEPDPTQLVGLLDYMADKTPRLFNMLVDLNFITEYSIDGCSEEHTVI